MSKLDPCVEKLQPALQSCIATLRFLPLPLGERRVGLGGGIIMLAFGRLLSDARQHRVNEVARITALATFLLNLDRSLYRPLQFA